MKDFNTLPLDDQLDIIEDLVEQGNGRVVIARKLFISDSKATRLIIKAKERKDQAKANKELEEAIQRSSISISSPEEESQEIPLQTVKEPTFLIVGDPHAKPGVSNDRFSWLGRLIVEIKPDVVVCMGDMADMHSLSLFDVGKKSFEGRRYIHDIEATHDALRKINAPLKEFNKNREDKYTPVKHMLYGNHEKRILRAIDSDSKLDGTLSLDDLKYNKFGWNTTPFLKPLIVGGVAFQHYFTSGLMDRPISGENIGNAILKKYHSSALQGHTHLLALAFQSDIRGRNLVGGSVGCYFEHKEDYVSDQAQNNWWRGVVLLKNVSEGSVKDFEFISLDTIKSNYRIKSEN